MNIQIFYYVGSFIKPLDIQNGNSMEYGTYEMKSPKQHNELANKMKSRSENRKIIQKTHRIGIENVSTRKTNKAKKLAIYQLVTEFYKGTDLYETSVYKLLREFKNFINHKKSGKAGKLKDGKTFNIIIGKQNKTSYSLGDPIHPSRARHIWIASSHGRSGSSFLGECLNRYPGSFYSYEPEKLIYSKDYGDPFYGFHNISDHVFKCQPRLKYFEYERKNFDSKANSWTAIRVNIRLWKIYQALTPNFEFRYGVTNMMQLYHSICPLFPIHLTKTISFPVNETETVLNDPELSRTLKLIVLFRDPRGILNSLIRSVNWQIGNRNIMVAKICDKMTPDALAVVKLKKNFPGLYPR